MAELYDLNSVNLICLQARFFKFVIQHLILLFLCVYTDF